MALQVTQAGRVPVTFRHVFRNADGTARNISAATVRKAVFKPPTGAPIEVDCAFETDGSDGAIIFTTDDASDLDNLRPGEWEVQFNASGPGLIEHSLRPLKFLVQSNLA